MSNRQRCEKQRKERTVCICVVCMYVVMLLGHPEKMPSITNIKYSENRLRLGENEFKPCYCVVAFINYSRLTC